MRYKEIGEIVECSEDAVKMRIHRARKRVRDAIRPYLEA
jgi:DNA-directed RNA polymerase specialized sigma24 family protein